MNDKDKIAWWNAKSEEATRAAKAQAERDGGVAKESAPEAQTEAPADAKPAAQEASSAAATETAVPADQIKDVIDAAIKPLAEAVQTIKTEFESVTKQLAELKQSQADAVAKTATDLTEAVEKAGAAARGAEEAAKQAKASADYVKSVTPRGGGRVDEPAKDKVAKEGEDTKTNRPVFASPFAN